MQFKLEVIGFNIESCAIAQSAGAHRIELCANPLDAGTTPPLGFIKAARKLLQIEMYCMIRSRGGDFIYSNEDFQIMLTDIELCKQAGCDGVVIGLLNRDGSIDKQRTQQMVELAYPMGVTFQRAFDRTNDPFKAMEDIIDAGCERILTSGLKPSALDGAPLIVELMKKADGRINIMPGAGLTADNILQLADLTNAEEYHMSAKIKKSSTMDFINPEMNETLNDIIPDAEALKKVIQILSNR